MVFFCLVAFRYLGFTDNDTLSESVISIGVQRSREPRIAQRS